MRSRTHSGCSCRYAMGMKASFSFNLRTIQVFCCALAACLGLALPLHGQTLRKTGTIDLPGPKGQRFDYLTMDDEDHYLLSAQLGPGILYVIDVRTNRVVKAIPGVPGITAIAHRGKAERERIRNAVPESLRFRYQRQGS